MPSKHRPTSITSHPIALRPDFLRIFLTLYLLRNDGFERSADEGATKAKADVGVEPNVCANHQARLKSRASAADKGKASATTPIIPDLTLAAIRPPAPMTIGVSPITAVVLILANRGPRTLKESPRWVQMASRFPWILHIPELICQSRFLGWNGSYPVPTLAEVGQGDTAVLEEEDQSAALQLNRRRSSSSDPTLPTGPTKCEEVIVPQSDV
nr:hypothetical protein Iba_chr13fCG7870 [Ipomoea batatas]